MKKEISGKTSKRKNNFFITRKLLFFLIGLNTLNLTASDGLNLRLNKLYAPAPSAADLGRFSAVQVGLFTGTAKYSIPIYEFRTSNLTVPISLEYSSNGLIVDKIASWVGFDWTLNAGGVINRYRKGKVDKPGTRPTYPSNWSSMTISQKKVYLDQLLSNDRDLEPDEFTFSFMNYSGKFVFDELGNIKQIPYTNFKIVTNTTGGEYTYFTITTPDGVRYKFDQRGYTYPATETSYASSYYLTQIIHPCGEVVNLNYTRIALTQYAGVSQTATTVVQQIYHVLPPVNLSEVSTGVNPFYSDVVYLDNIQFPGIGSIVFEKSTTRQDNYGDYELKKIKILDNNSTLIKSFEFFHQFPTCSASYQSKTNLGIYEPNSEHNKRMFLDSLQIQSNSSTTPKISSYVFKYNNLTGLPARYSFSQDHWGYFNGKFNSDFAIITEVPVNYRGLFTNMIPTTANRSPDYLYAQKGMLQKIIFPTRGYTTIEYEPHKDSYNNILGGCRVVRTKTYDLPASTPVISKYVYSGSQTSLNYKYYTEYYTIRFTNFCSMDGFVTYGKLSSNSFYNLIINGLYHILYSNVEILSGENAENGKEIHHFIIDTDATGTPWNTTISDAQIYPLVKSNTGWKTGLQDLKNTLNNNSAMLMGNSFSYNFSETRNTKEVLCLAVEKFYDPSCYRDGDMSSIQPYKVIGYTTKSIWSYVNQETVTSYSPSGNIVTTKNYSYNDAGLLSSELSAASNGNAIETKYRYPSDINIGIYSSMVILTMINYPVEVTSLNNNNIIGSTLTTYKANGSSYVPDKVYSLESSSSFPGGSFTYFNGSIKDSRYGSTPELSYDFYNSTNGNIRQTTAHDGLTTAYLWDSGGNYSMAYVKGATYSQISSQDGKTNTYSSKVLWTDLNSLVPGAFITTYGYYSLVGIKDQTDPKGVTTSYVPDSFGRLKLIRNDDEHILNRYKYNYKQ